MKKFLKTISIALLSQEVLHKSLMISVLTIFSTIIFFLLIPLLVIYKFAKEFYNTIENLQANLTEQLTSLATQIKESEGK